MEIFGFGINASELMVLIVVGLLILGPNHLAQSIRGFAKLIALLKRYSAQMRSLAENDLSTLGINNVDWESFNPRQLDPRVMIRDAVKEEMEAWIKQMEELSKQSKTEVGSGNSGETEKQSDQLNEAFNCDNKANEASSRDNKANEASSCDNKTDAPNNNHLEGK